MQHDSYVRLFLSVPAFALYLFFELVAGAAQWLAEAFLRFANRISGEVR